MQSLQQAVTEQFNAIVASIQYAEGADHMKNADELIRFAEPVWICAGFPELIAEIKNKFSDTLERHYAAATTKKERLQLDMLR